MDDFTWRICPYYYMYMDTIFWISLLGVLYAYFLYPGLLYVLGLLFPKPLEMGLQNYTPSVSIIMPVHNEANVIATKLSNFEQIDYPSERLKIIIISDGSTDNTLEVIRHYPSTLNIHLVEISERHGKAHALNMGLKHVDTEIVVFSDASILLDKEALLQIVKPFQDSNIGCVSGEDHIAQGGGEGLYGQYELFLRNQESIIGSIVGASGSFYAQRSHLCRPFEEGLAPDFLSVLNTVKAGYRAITQRKARGYMKAVKGTSQEFQRKVRTLLRGMTALFAKSSLLNPFKYGLFSLFLVSHKLMRWLVPMLLIALLVSNYQLVEHLFYRGVFIAQIVFYSITLLAYPTKSPLHQSIVGRIPLFFVLVNIAIVVAWYRYLRGDRQELWTPSKRSEAG